MRLVGQQSRRSGYEQQSDPDQGPRPPVAKNGACGQKPDPQRGPQEEETGCLDLVKDQSSETQDTLFVQMPGRRLQIESPHHLVAIRRLWAHRLPKKAR